MAPDGHRKGGHSGGQRTEQELMSFYGGEVSERDVPYTRKANKRRLVERAIHKISPDE